MRRAVRVARYFDPKDEQHGIHKLDALLDYFESEGGMPTIPVKINLARQRVRVSRDGRPPRLLPFADITVAELRAAAKAKKPGHRRKDPPVVAEIRRIATRSGVRALGVRLHKSALDLIGIPRSKLARFCTALGTAKLPKQARLRGNARAHLSGQRSVDAGAVSIAGVQPPAR